MGQVIVTFAAVDNQRTLPAYAARGAKVEELATSGTHARSTVTADAGDYARIVNNSSGLVWVTFAATPTAAVGTTYAIPPNTAADFGPLLAGDKASVIDDS